MRISDWSSDVCSSDLFGLPCVIYMGEVDIERQQPNVFRMKLLGAEVRAVKSGSRTLKDAMNEALRDWEIGRASCRERVCQYVSVSVVAVSLKTKNSKLTCGHVSETPNKIETLT